MCASLPSGPNLAHLKYQAQDLRKRVHAGDPEASQRVARVRPDVHTGDNPGESFRLADALFVIAREYGFPSWPKLKAYVEANAGPGANRLRAYQNEVSFYEERAEGLVSFYRSGLPSVMRQIRKFHPDYAALTENEIAQKGFSKADALLVTAREHGFDNWSKLRRHVLALADGKAYDPFFHAFAAIQQNDMETLGRLLEQDSSLIRARGTNGNSLLNLAAGCKQMEAATLLIAAGADVNAANNRGWAPLHQAGYSNLSGMAQALLDAGAEIGQYAHGDGGTPLMFALFWGHREVAELLAAYDVVPRNLRIAAGVGRQAMVEEMFTQDGTLMPEAGLHRLAYRPHSGFPVWHPSDDPQEILDEAFVYAARNGRTNVMGYLLERGANIDGDPYRGTALAWVASRGTDLETARWLLEHGATIDQRGTFGGPSHGQGITALHLAAQGGHLEMVRFLMEHGADKTITDDLYQSTPEGWAGHFGWTEVAAYLK